MNHVKKRFLNNPIHPAKILPCQIEVVNRQKIKKISLLKLKKYIRQILALQKIYSCQLSIVLCDNKFITKLNKKLFKKNIATDVISYSLGDDFSPYYLGEVVVSVEQAVKCAAVYNNTWDKELVLYIIHGILHLFGYDDCSHKKSKIMEKRQEEILGNIVW